MKKIPYFIFKIFAGRKFRGSQKPRNFCVSTELNFVVHGLEEISREITFAVVWKFRFSILIKNNFTKLKERNGENETKIKFKDEGLSSMKCVLEINKNYLNSWAITSKTFPSLNSHSDSQESFSSLDDRCWMRRCRFGVYYCHLVQQIARLLVGQYQQMDPVVLNKFLHFSVHLGSLQRSNHLK